MTPTEYALDRIKETTVSTTGGYPWLYIKDFLPEEHYKKIKETGGTGGSAMLVDVFDSPAIVSELYKKFGAWEIRSEAIKSIYSFWQWAGAGYSLKPHEDSFPRVFTMAYYFAQDDKCPEAGTAIYDVDYVNKEYTTLTVAPYVPNSAIIFAPGTDSTWHGVNVIEKQIDRQSAVLVFSAQEWDENQLHYAEWKPGRTVNYGR